MLHLDTLSGLDELKVCVGYKHRGRRLTEFPAAAHRLAEVEPIYETMTPWSAELGDCRRWEDLPEAARQYVQRLSELVRVPVRMIGVGPAREQVILLPREA